jgi:hypothetical protein
MVNQIGKTHTTQLGLQLLRWWSDIALAMQLEMLEMH